MSAITGLVASGVAATTGDVASTVQSGQSAQNAVEENYQTRKTLATVNKQLQGCTTNDRACINRAVADLRQADKILDNALNECVRTGNSACVEQHLNNILASDSSPEMKQIAEQLQRLHIGIEVSGSLNETNDLSVKARELVEDVRLGQDIGCVSGSTKNCTNPIAERTGTQKIGHLINDLTVRQIAAALGADYDPLTKEEITPNEAQMAKLTLLSLGLTERVSGVTRLTDDALIQLEKKYGQDLVKVLSKKEAEIARKKQVIENNANAENMGYGDAAVRDFQPGKTHRAENINAGQVTDRDGLPRIDSQKNANDSQVAKNLGLEDVKSLDRWQTQRPAWKTGTLVSDHVLTEPRKFTMVVDEGQINKIRVAIDKGQNPSALLGGWGGIYITSFRDNRSIT